MAKNKVLTTYTIEQTHADFLTEIASKFDIADESKALRILIEYAKQEGDLHQIFAPDNMRCHDPENCPVFKTQSRPVES